MRKDKQARKNGGPGDVRSSCRVHRGIGVQWKLLAYLGVFIAFMLLVLYVFQVRLLGTFYEDIIEKELDRTSQALVRSLGDDSLVEDTVYQYAVEYSMCIQVYRIVDAKGYIVASADVSSGCVIHHASGRQRGILYNDAVNNGGTYLARVQFQAGGMLWLDSAGDVQMGGALNSEMTDEEKEKTERFSSLRSKDVSALYVRVAQDAAGAEYVIYLDVGLTPMSATVTTFTTQFWWIAIILFAGALVTAYLMSRRISRPLVRMTESARHLAQGHYDVSFSGNGYRETRELAQTLNYAASELSRVDGLQKELIANISHDLRTPLTMIKGYSEVMRDIPGENTPENVQVIIDEATHLSELVNDLLDVSRIQSGTRKMDREVLPLTDTVRQVLLRYEKLTHHDGYTIFFEAGEEAWVNADRGMLLQVLYNLINNAINYSGADKIVEVTQRVEDGQVRIGVRDHGEGIPPEQIPMIWDRYYKVDRVHRRAMIGTGLGLSIVKGILEMHHAQYGVESTVGVGSEFWFRMPLVPPPEEETDGKGSLPAPGEKGGRNDG